MAVSPKETLPEYALDPEEVLSRLETDARRGLSAEDVKNRREVYGRNLLEEAKPRSAWLIFLDQF